MEWWEFDSLQQLSKLSSIIRLSNPEVHICDDNEVNENHLAEELPANLLTYPPPRPGCHSNLAVRSSSHQLSRVSYEYDVQVPLSASRTFQKQTLGIIHFAKPSVHQVISGVEAVW